MLMLATIQLADYDFFRSIPDTVHPSDPFHLIFCFHPLGNALGFGHLPDHQFILLVGLGINFL